jgi:hypothetical protein
MTRRDGIVSSCATATRNSSLIRRRETFSCIFFVKNRNRATLAGCSGTKARANAKANCETGASKGRFFCPGGHDNPLKRLDPEKEIQGIQAFFLWFSLFRLGWAWPDFEKIGFALE